VNRWSRIVWTLALAASLAWVGGGWLGYAVRDDATLARHTLLVFSALLALVLTQGWVAIHLIAAERLLSRVAGCSTAERATLVRARRQGGVAALVAMASAIGEFAVSNAVYPARLTPRWHALGALASVLILAVALAVEMGALRRAGIVARALDR
jgi:hypothetical protein